ncbi:MAG TPA: hypothetical protein VEO01_27640 [Pseudonocardiaceae bacterium]|nr:hypothetical protein [Pseudonocardiaceae bacterium]
MDFWDLTKVIFRRWKIALPLLIITFVATGAVAATAKPDYVMTSYVQFIPAKVAPNDNAGNASLRNPWNQLGLNTLGQAAIYATQDQRFLDALKAGGHTTNVLLTITYPNPIITVQVVGPTPQDTIVTTQLVIKQLRDSADALQRQSGVHDPDMIATQRLDQGENLQASGGKVKRAIVAVAAAGLLVTGGGTVLFDAAARRRARRRAQLEKVDPLAVEIALAREAAAGTTNGKEVPVLPKATAVHAPPTAPAASEPVTMIHPKLVVPPDREEPAETPTPPAAAERSVVAKPSLKAGTYRSINAQSEPDEDRGTIPASATTGVPSSVSSDVRIVLQPEWVTGENGGKSR